MKPVMQTRFGKAGNCLQACIASLVEKPLEDVPDFAHMPGGIPWWRHFDRYFTKNYGLFPWPVMPELFVLPYDVYYLVFGQSPRGFRHACIGLNGLIAHDPHPEGGGVVPDQYILFMGFIRSVSHDTV